MAVGACAFLVMFIGSGTAVASNGVLCSTWSNPCGSKWAVHTVLDWSLRNKTSAKLVSTAGETLDACTASTTKQELTANPGSTGTYTVKFLTINHSSCTVTTDTVKLGGAKVENIAGTGNGKVYATESSEVTVNVFSSCVYGIEAGTILGEVKGGSPAIFVTSAVTKRTSGGFLCPETAKWVAESALTEPISTQYWIRPT